MRVDSVKITNCRHRIMNRTQEEFVAGLRKFLTERGWVHDEKRDCYWKATPPPFEWYRSELTFSKEQCLQPFRFHSLPGQEVYLYTLVDAMTRRTISPYHIFLKFNFEHNKYESCDDTGIAFWRDREFQTSAAFYEFVTQQIIESESPPPI